MGQEKLKPIPGRNTYKSVMSLQDISAGKVCQWFALALSAQPNSSNGGCKDVYILHARGNVTAQYHMTSAKATLPAMTNKWKISW